MPYERAGGHTTFWEFAVPQEERNPPLLCSLVDGEIDSVEAKSSLVVGSIPVECLPCHSTTPEGANVPDLRCYRREENGHERHERQFVRPSSNLKIRRRAANRLSLSNSFRFVGLAWGNQT
jgi:hypothetical protein